MWENNEYKIEFRDKSILDFEQAVLTSGQCDSLLPMMFIGDDSGQVAYYDCCGFRPLSRYMVATTDDAFYILEKVLLIIDRTVEFLLTPAKITLSMDTVFYQPETGRIKIAYVPQAAGYENLRRNLLFFIAELKKEIDDGNTGYLDRFARIVNCNSYRPKDLVNRLGLIRRELYGKTHCH